MMLLCFPLSLSLVASSLRTPTDRWQPRTSLPRAGSPAMSATALSDLKVYELKAVCRAKGLKVSGRKAEVVARVASCCTTAHTQCPPFHSTPQLIQCVPSLSLHSVASAH